MTYRQMIAMLQAMPAVAMDFEAKVYDSRHQGFYPVEAVGVTTRKSSALEKDHPYLIIEP